jgi:hypothetical protein
MRTTGSRRKLPSSSGEASVGAMRIRTLLLVALVVVARSAGVVAQAPQTRTVGQVHGLETGKAEVALAVGFYWIEWQGTDVHGIPDVTWKPPASASISADLGIGISRHVLAQFGLALTGYKDDMYWRPEIPHNPYLATASLLTVTGGLRWDIRDPRYRVRPYVGGGVVAARFANIHRGPSEWCPDLVGLPAGSCFQEAPELFTGTRVTGYVDAGVNFLVRPRWGFIMGTRAFKLQGSGSAPAIPADRPTGTDDFWHGQLFVGVLFRVG